MVWVKTSDDEPEKPAFLALGRDRAAGTGVWFIGLCYANRWLTDGFVPIASLPPGGERLARRLVEMGLWKAAPGGYRIVDYFSNQPSRAEVEVLREERRKAGQAGGLRSGQVRRSNAEASAKHVASGDGEATREATTNPVPVPVPGAQKEFPITDRATAAAWPGRPDLLALSERGWRWSPEQAALLAELARNERSSERDVASGFGVVAAWVREAPPEGNLIEHVLAKQHAVKAERVVKADARERAWNEQKRVEAARFASSLGDVPDA